jgi:acylphosphatase
VREIAERMRVSGTVRNSPDGSVVLAAQADEEILRSFLEEVQTHFSRYIRDARVTWMPPDVNYEDFTIVL